MSPARRMAWSLLAALLVALALFWLMQWMITPADEGFDRPPRMGAVDFLRVERDEQAQVRERMPPEEPEVPEPPEMPELQALADPPTPDLDMDFAALDPATLGSGPSLGIGDGLLWAGEATPLVQIEPQYPRRALAAGVEGHVTMEFTIAPDGSVSDVTVVDAEPPGVFNAEAVRALMRWRFRPHVVDGEPRARRARQTIHFSLDEA